MKKMKGIKRNRGGKKDISSKTAGNPKTIIFSSEKSCDIKSTMDWIDCMEKEGNSSKCRTIKNNSYKDCKS